jgi:hypothetical protein
MTRVHILLSLPAILAAILAGCGAPSEPAYTPEAKGATHDPTSRDAAADVETGDFEREERRLEEAFGGAEGEGEADDPVPRSEPAPPPGVEPNTATGLDTAQRCAIACKALASMKRAAARVCEISGDDDERCENLRERVEKARQRVSARCPQCAAAQPD